MILVSACLLGENVKYNGGNNLSEMSHILMNREDVISICPEVLGGLPTPRIPAERRNMQVINKAGEDVTTYFERGAQKTLDIALKNGVKIAILQERSPSCGVHQIYDCSFSDVLVDGSGYTTKLLQKHGIKVMTLKEYYDSYRNKWDILKLAN